MTRREVEMKLAQKVRARKALEERERALREETDELLVEGVRAGVPVAELARRAELARSSVYTSLLRAGITA